MKKYSIKHRYTGELLAELEGDSLAKSLELAVIQKTNLTGANLRREDLTGANLTGANLRRADFTGANLTGTNLSGANLSGAYLKGANLTGANLKGANLKGANLARANLTGISFSPIKNDFWDVLDAAPEEVLGLRRALVEGRVDGSAYEGECACLVGTIANLRAQDYRNLAGLRPDSSRLAERFFLGIREGDRPETNPCSKMAIGWIDEWLNTKK